jgi:hypothetical protein
MAPVEKAPLRHIPNVDILSYINSILAVIYVNKHINSILAVIYLTKTSKSIICSSHIHE